MSFIRYQSPFTTNNCNGIYNIMYCVYSNILMYSSSENYSGLISSVSESADVFLILCHGHRLAGPGCSDWILMYVELVAKYAVTKMQTISHINICGFINSNVLNVGFLIHP